MRSSNILTFIGGVVAGAAVAILLAPKNGEQTRKDIKDAIDEHIKMAKEKYSKFHSCAEQVREDLKADFKKEQADL